MADRDSWNMANIAQHRPLPRDPRKMHGPVSAAADLERMRRARERAELDTRIDALEKETTRLAGEVSAELIRRKVKNGPRKARFYDHMTPIE